MIGRLGSLGGDLPNDSSSDGGMGDTSIDPGGGITGGRQTGGGGATVNYQEHTGVLSSPRAEYPIPPGGCILLRVQMSPSEKTAVLGVEDDPNAILAALGPTRRAQVLGAVNDWARRYPHAPPALIRLGVSSAISPYAVFVVRPYTEWDPALDSYPIYPPGSPQSDTFNAALRIFFPEFALDPVTGADMRGGQNGSLTVYGPFPVSEKFVTPQMVGLAVRVAKMPGAFQPGMTGGSSGPDFLGSLTTGLKATAATGGNYWVGIGAAASKFIIGAFDWLFGDAPQPPAWLTTLMGQKALRDPGGSPSFAGTIGGAGSFQKAYQCPRVTINPRGTMTLFEGYDAFLTELGVGQGGDVPWLLLGAGALALYFMTD